MYKVSRKCPCLTGIVAVLLCALALVCQPAVARAESVKDRVVECTEEEQNELLKNARIGAHLGGLTSLYAERDFPDANVLQFDNISDIAASLSAGKLDYAILPDSTALLYMRTNPSYTYLSCGLYSFDQCQSVAKGNDELLSKLNEALAKLTADGTIEDAEQRWFVDGDYSMDSVPEVTDESAPVLRFVTSATNEPTSFVQNGQLVGIDIEIAKRVAYELGMRAEFSDTTFAGELTAVVTGKADVALGYAPTEEREKQLSFTQTAYKQNWVAMFVDEDAEGTGFIEELKSNIKSTFIAEDRWQMIVNGLGITVGISLGAFALATVFGALLCWMGERGGAAAGFSHAYCKLVTGIPVLVWLMLLYYVVFQGVDIPAALVAVICFGLEAAAPLSGVFATGLAAVDKGQVEASLALGFSGGETFRRVVLPQAARSVWGLYAGQLTSIIKGTSIVGYVAITDLTKVSDIIRSRTFQAFVPLVSTALVYFVVIALFSWLLGFGARALDPKRRKPASILKGIER